MRLSVPYRSADERTLYANDANGTRYRVAFDGRELVLVKRLSRAAQKALKRKSQRSRKSVAMT